MVQGYLQNIRNRDDIDIIIALGTAKEGFDWQWCEMCLTVGVRGSYNRQNEMCLFAKTKCVCFFLLKIIHNMNKKEQNQCFTVCFPLKNPTI